MCVSGYVSINIVPIVAGGFRSPRVEATDCFRQKKCMEYSYFSSLHLSELLSRNILYNHNIIMKIKKFKIPGQYSANL